MGRDRRRGRVTGLVVAVAASWVVALAAAQLLTDQARTGLVPGIAVSVFGTFLTSTAIIAAFSIDERSRWPTPWELLDRAHVSTWFFVGLGSVVVALLAGGFDSTFLAAFSLTLALVAIPLGARGLWGLISLSSDQGCRKLVVDLLAQSIRECRSRPRRDEADLGEIDSEDHVPTGFLLAEPPDRLRHSGVSIELVPSVVRAYADRRAMGAILALIDEVRAAAGQALGNADADAASMAAHANSADIVLGVQREVFEDLAIRVISGQLGDATTRIALARAGEAIIDAAGRVRAPGPEIDPAKLRGIEVLASRHLTALSRLAGWTAHAAHSLLMRGGRLEGAPGEGDMDTTRLAALHATCSELQQAVRWAVDPDPPGAELPAGHPWRTGLSDPESALVWLWAAAESPTGPLGVGMYALCEILTGKKFSASYWEGFDIFTEVERRLYAEGDGDDLVAASRAAVERAGGLTMLSLELGAIRLARTLPRTWPTPASLGKALRRDDRHVACNLFLAGGGFKPAGRDPVADLARLLTDRPTGSLWSMVHEQLSALPGRSVFPPLRPLFRRPAACALALCLRLTVLDGVAGADDIQDWGLEEFVHQLPGPLLESTLTLALELTSTERVALPRDRSRREEALIEASGFVCRITPGPLPRQESRRREDAPELATARGAERMTKPAPLVGANHDHPAACFLAAAERIASVGSSDARVDLIQCDLRWLSEWTDMRSSLDAELLAGALKGRVTVRRIILYDLPSEIPDHRSAAKLHRRWTESLAVAARCFEDQGAGYPEASPPYEVRLLILPRNGDMSAIPADGIWIHDPTADDGLADDSQFAFLWARLALGARLGGDIPGLIKLDGIAESAAIEDREPTLLLGF